MESDRIVDFDVLRDVNNRVHGSFSTELRRDTALQLARNIDTAVARERSQLLDATQGLHDPPHSHVVASILRSDGTALAIELPALQQSLNEKQLHVQRIELMQSSLGTAMGDSHRDSPRGDSNLLNPVPSIFHSNDISPAGTIGTFSGVESTAMFTSQGRLSVHA